MRWIAFGNRTFSVSASTPYIDSCNIWLPRHIRYHNILVIITPHAGSLLETGSSTQPVYPKPQTPQQPFYAKNHTCTYAHAVHACTQHTQYTYAHTHRRMYAHSHRRTHGRMHAPMYQRTRAHMHTCTHACMHTHMYACVRACTLTWTSQHTTQAYTHVYAPVYT